jgi:hypothetical protein
MAQEKNADANPPIARGHVIARPETQTASGAPTDKAHRDAATEPSLAIPAGLSLEELAGIAEDDQSVESGTEWLVHSIAAWGRRCRE